MPRCRYVFVRPGHPRLKFFRAEDLIDFSGVIKFSIGHDFSRKRGGPAWNIERAQAVMFGTSLTGALSTPKSLIFWCCITADRLMVVCATSAKHWSDKMAPLIKRTSTVSRDGA